MSPSKDNVDTARPTAVNGLKTETQQRIKFISREEGKKMLEVCTQKRNAHRT